MRNGIVLLIATCIGMVLAGPAAATAPLCDARPGKTVAASEVVRVFRDGSVLRGCRHGSRKTLRLAAIGSCAEVGPIAAAGRYVAVTRVSCEDDAAISTVVLFDFRTERDVLGAAAYTGATPAATATSVSEMVLTRSGALAWIGRLEGAGSELHLRRASSRVPELVASSTTLGLTDLAVSPRKLFWLKDGIAHVMDL
jgi:hypothetical protein